MKKALVGIALVFLLFTTFIGDRDVVAHPLTQNSLAAATSYRAPLSSTLDAALAWLNSPYTPAFYENQASGSSSELARGVSLATLARSVVEGNRNSTIVNALVTNVKKLINSTRDMPDLSMTIDARSQYSSLFAIALLNNPAASDVLSANFSSAEQAKMQLMAKAAVASSAFVYAAYDGAGNARPPQRFSMNGNTNVYSSPNFVEGPLGMFIVGSTIMGISNVKNFLDTYNHTNFLSQLSNSSTGLPNVYTAFASTFTVTVSGTTYDASDATKKAQLVNSILDNISTNDSQGRPFFRGVKLTDFVADPTSLYYVLPQPASGIEGTFDKIANEGDYIGSLGMGHEFDTLDASGVRDSAGYTSLGFTNDILTRYFVELTGYWGSSSNTTAKSAIDSQLHVGFSDIEGKVQNGYWSHANGSDHFDSLSTPDTWYNPMIMDLAEAMGFHKRIFFSDNFQHGTSNWTTPSGESSFAINTTQPWTGRPTSSSSTIKILESSASNNSTTLVSNYRQSNYDVYVKLKLNSWGTGSPQRIELFGRYQDGGNNYYLGYDYSIQKWQIKKRVNSTLSTLSSSAIYTLTAGQLYQLRGSFNGSTIKLYINSTLIASATDTTFTQGAIALNTRYSDASFTDVLVTANTSGFSDTTPPTTPSITSSSGGSGQVKLSWSTSTDNVAVERYEIFRDGVVVGTTAGTSYTDSGLGNATYTYIVKAYDTSGNISAPSSAVTVSTTSLSSGTPYSVSGVTASGYQTGYEPAKSIDGDYSTRWSSGGDGQWIQYDLGSQQTVHYVAIAVLYGNTRYEKFDVQVSSDGPTWITTLSGQVSSGTALQLEYYPFTATAGRYVRIVGHGYTRTDGTTSLYNSFVEVRIF